MSGCLTGWMRNVSGSCKTQLRENLRSPDLEIYLGPKYGSTIASCANKVLKGSQEGNCLFNLEAAAPPQSGRNAIYFAHASCLESSFLILLCGMSKSPEFSEGVHKQLLAGLNIFNTASLTSEEDIAIAVAVLEGTLDDHSTGPIIHCSLRPERPYAFEFMISCTSEPLVLY